jgi:hypothetical protein
MMFLVGLGATLRVLGGFAPIEGSVEMSVLAVSTFGWIILALIWVAIAFWPARVAGRKRHSFIGYFIFSLFFFPLALIMAYVVQDRRALPGRA